MNLDKDFLPLGEKTAKPGRVLQVFLNTNLTYSYDGLTTIAKKNKIRVDELSPGTYVVFVNRAKTMLKLFAANNVLASYRSPHGRLEMQMIQEIPKAFKSTGGIDFDASLAEALSKILAKKRRSKNGEATK